MKILCVRCDPKRTLLQILQPIVEKLRYSLRQFVFYAVCQSDISFDFCLFN
jgi:hypothetical protein